MIFFITYVCVNLQKYSATLIDFYKNKKVLITGNTGFKGSWLSIWLSMMGAEVHGYSKNIPSNPSMYELTKLNNQVETSFGDIDNTEKLKVLLNTIRPEIIFHLAAQPIVGIGYQYPMETFRTNILGTTSILEAFRCLETPSCLINISSDKCYLNKNWVWGYRENDELGGNDPYSASKASAELVLNSYYNSFFKSTEHKRIATARAGNVIGGGDWGLGRLIPDFINAMETNAQMTIKNPQSIRPWQHVLDAIYGYLILAKKLYENPKLNGQAFNFGSQRNTYENVETVVRMLSKEFSEYNIGIKIANESVSSFAESQILKLNCDKSITLLNWQTKLDLKETIKYTAEWYKAKRYRSCDLLTLTQRQILKYQNEYISSCNE